MTIIDRRRYTTLSAFLLVVAGLIWPRDSTRLGRQRAVTRMARTDREWLLRDKWDAFYSGSFAPHLPDGCGGGGGGIDALPWRTKAPTAQLLEHLARAPLPPGARCLELGCGTGENLAALARHAATAFVLGVDIVPAAAAASEATLSAALAAEQPAAATATAADLPGRRAAPRVRGEVLCADVLELLDAPPGGRLPADGGSWEFDFVLDVQTFHCLRRVDARRAAEVYARLLRPGRGVLLMLTGNADEPHERGPERLTREEVRRRGRDVDNLPLIRTRAAHAREGAVVACARRG